MTMMRYAEKNSDLLDFLNKRRSVSVKLLGGHGPTQEEIEHLIKTAARVPDHGKLAPWYFIVIQGEHAQKLNAEAAKIFAEKNNSLEPDKLKSALEIEHNRFTRAPVVIAVISRPRLGKIHAWEQVLSAGAVCHQLGLAANTMGYGACWLTEWPAYDLQFRAILGCDLRDQIAGFIYVGTPLSAPEERIRPEINNLINYFGQPVINKGDSHD